MHQLSEVDKIWLSTLLGFLAGVFTEPIKIWIGQRYQRRKLRKMCYQQILLIRNTLAHIRRELEHPEQLSFADMTAEVYARMTLPNINLGPLKYAIEEQASILYQLEVYPTVTRLVNGLQDVNKEMPIGDMRGLCDLLVYSIDSDARRGNISAKYLTELAYEARWSERSSGVSPSVQKLDNRYSDLPRSSFVILPFIAKQLYRLKRLLAWAHDQQPR